MTSSSIIKKDTVNVVAPRKNYWILWKTLKEKRHEIDLFHPYIQYQLLVLFIFVVAVLIIRRVWRYQRSNQNPYIEEDQTTQWPKEKHTHKTKDRVTRTPLKTGGELRCSRRVSSSCSTSGTHHVNLDTNPVISRESQQQTL